MHSNSVGRGPTGIPLELAEGGGHHECARLIKEASEMESQEVEKKTRQVGFVERKGYSEFWHCENI